MLLWSSMKKKKKINRRVVHNINKELINLLTKVSYKIGENVNID